MLLFGKGQGRALIRESLALPPVSRLKGDPVCYGLNCAPYRAMLKS